MTHTMTLEQGDATKGVWQCLECDRRVIYDFDAPYNEDPRTVIVYGDENARHTGSVAPQGQELTIGSVTVKEAR